MNNWEKLVKKILDRTLLPETPYRLNVEVVGNEPYINIEVDVDTSKYHQVGPNYDPEYYVRMDELESKILDSFDILGDLGVINSLKYKKINFDWIDDLSPMVDLAISDFIDGYEFTYDRLNYPPKKIGFSKNEYEPSLSLIINLGDAGERIKRELYEYLGNNLSLWDFYIDFRSGR
jgi:hypothetical protein